LSDYTSKQIARELDAALARHEILEPSMLIVCDRVSLGAATPSTSASTAETAEADKPAEDIRVTFDSNLRYLNLRSQNPDLAHRQAEVRGEHVKQPLVLDWAPEYLRQLSEIKIIPSDESIVEIKTSKPYPEWLRASLDETRTFPQSFSKYGTAATQASRASA
jgi:hypothetical protein